MKIQDKTENLVAWQIYMDLPRGFLQEEFAEQFILSQLSTLIFDQEEKAHFQWC